MPFLAYASNFTWVMVIGLLGPSVPAIIEDLGIGYTQAGLFFTTLSLGSVFGTLLAGTAADALNRRALFAAVAFCLGAGLFSMALASTYAMALLAVALFSLTGSPAGTVGQSIMLEMFPQRRERYLALLTMFASIGSLTAPLLVAVNLRSGVPWRWPFAQTGLLALVLAGAILVAPLPRGGARQRPGIRELGRLLAHPRVLSTALLVVLSVGPDLGFSFWLAEHFRSDLGVSLELSSAVVSLYLAGMIAGRLATSTLVRVVAPGRLLCLGPALALAALALFLASPSLPVKLGGIVLYGLGVAPIFPLLMARGTAVFPHRPGAVSGLLFSSVSVGGVIFPQALGAVAERIGLQRAFALLGLALAGILLAALAAELRRGNPR